MGEEKRVMRVGEEESEQGENEFRGKKTWGVLSERRERKGGKESKGKGGGRGETNKGREENELRGKGVRKISEWERKRGGPKER